MPNTSVAQNGKTWAFHAICGNAAFRTAALRLFPFACLAVMFTVYYAWGLFVIADTFQGYATFNYAYSNFLATTEFPQWLPYAAYGSPAEPYIMTFLGPFQMLAIFGGSLFHVSDAWVLFYLSTFFESFCFVCSAYLFAAELFENEISASAVATWAAVSIFWNIQIFWPHRIVLYLPLMLYFALRFHRTGDVRQVLRAGLIGVISLIGSVAYLAPVYGFLMCFFFLLLRLFDRQGACARIRRPGAATAAEFLVLVLVTGLYLFLFANAFNGAAFTAPERDTLAGTASMDVFLNYGGSALEKLPEFVLGLWVAHAEYFFYLGAVATGLTLFALTRVRSGVFWALAGTCACLFLLSLGPQGLVGYALYWIPGMNRFRHLSFLLPLVRVLLLFLAGFGLDHLLGKPGERRGILLWLSIGALALIALKHTLPVNIPTPGWSGFVPEICFGLAVLGVLCTRPLDARLPLALGLALAVTVAFELGSAHYFLQTSTGTFNRNYGRYPGDGLDICAVQDFPFQGRRLTPETVFSRSRALIALTARQPVNNFALLQFVGADPCAPIFRIDYAMPRILELLNKAAPGALAQSNLEIDPRMTLSAAHWRQALGQPWFCEAFGCDGGKLMLETPQGQRLDVSGSVRHFSANRLVVDVDGGAQGGSLYYADAFHPEWKATVDGQTVAVAVAREAFKAVAVPPGVHTVALAFYDPWREWARRVLAVVSTLVLAHLFATGLREQTGRARPRPDSEAGGPAKTAQADVI